MVEPHGCWYHPRALTTTFPQGGMAMATGKSRGPYQTTQSLIGKRFGKVTVISLGERSGSKRVCHCRCDCGSSFTVTSNRLGGERRKLGGDGWGCPGCRFRGNVKHGKTKSREFNIWNLMIARCCNQNAHAYERYGGRGISVCDRWRGVDGFANFLADMGESPSLNHSIDRFPNRNGDYEPGNCRWATEVQQQNNRRNNRRLTHDGQTMTLAEWSRATGLGYRVIYDRLEAGWLLSDALTCPKQQKKSH